MVSLINHFYSSFSELNAEGMAQCYHDKIFFKDPAFGELKGERAKNMWGMLCSRQQGKEFKVNLIKCSATEHAGTATWEAFYTFGKTGKKVHNVIQTEFKFKEGKIIEHIDDFDMYTWSKQAFGVTGILIGWTSFFQNKVQKLSNRYLDQFENEKRTGNVI